MFWRRGCARAGAARRDACAARAMGRCGAKRVRAEPREGGGAARHRFQALLPAGTVGVDVLAKLRAPWLPVPPHRLRRPCRPSARISPQLLTCSHRIPRRPLHRPALRALAPIASVVRVIPPGRPSARVARVARMSARLHRPASPALRASPLQPPMRSHRSYKTVSFMQWSVFYAQN